MANNPVGGYSRVTVSLVQVEIVVTNDVGTSSTTMWTISNLRPGDSVTRNVARPRSTPSSPVRPVRLDATIIKTDPVELPGLQNNNVTENWLLTSAHTPLTNGDTAVAVGVSDQSPRAGGATTFTVYAANIPGPSLSSGGRRDSSAQFDVQVGISLSDGLTFDGIPPAPDGTTFDTSTGTWNVGILVTLTRGTLIRMSLPVPVTLTAASLATLPLEERCLTAKVVNAVPWPSKTENDTATLCLGEAKALLTRGKMTLIDFYPCIGVTSPPCTSADTLELVATARRNEIALPGFDRVDQFSFQTHGLTYLQPEEVLIQVPDPRGRGMKAGSVSWSTVDLLDLKDSQTRLPSDTWSTAKEDLTVTGPSGGQLPGSFTMNFVDTNIPDIEITDTTKVVGTAFDPGYDAEFALDFGSLGTYVLALDISATHTSSSTTYTDSGTYTFHVGPMAELEVRDGGASPEVGAGQRAYTVEAVNNGPDIAPAARVTLSGVPEGAEAIASEGSYTQGTCQGGLCQGDWTIGELKLMDGRRASGLTAAPTLTLITGAAMPADITATIANAQPYQVCIDSDGEDVDASNESACEDTSGNSWHTAAYYDYIDGNNTATIKAREGTGETPPAGWLE